MRLSLSLHGGGAIPRRTIEAYGEIAGLLYETHKSKPFKRSEIVSLLFDELDILREETRRTHIARMQHLGVIVRVTPGTAYKDATYRLGRRGLQMAGA